MARPIKETPILRGKDLERFEREVKENEHRRVSEEEYRRAEEIYRSIKFGWDD